MQKNIGAALALGIGYYGIGIWIDATVKKEIRWQQFELETLRSLRLQYLRREGFEEEITDRETLIGKLESWLARPLWQRLKTDPPHSRYCEYVQKKQ
jgi:hypothetical protein